MRHKTEKSYTAGKTQELKATHALDIRVEVKKEPNNKKKPEIHTSVKRTSFASYAVFILTIILGAFSLFGCDNNFELPADIDSIVWADKLDTASNGMPMSWEGWRIEPYSPSSDKLQRELKSASPEQYFALHISKTFSDGFTYNGRTVSDIAAEMQENELIFNKLLQLLKAGDRLKYGELIYTEGTPEGEKWTKSLYDKTIEYYGEDFLINYVFGGEFDRARAEADLASAEVKAKQLEEARQEIYEAYHRSCADEIEKIFSDFGASTVTKNGKLFVFIRKEQLATIEISDKESYILSLAKRRNYEHEEGDIPVFENSVTGFALEKIYCQTFDGSQGYAESDSELIEKINSMIEAGQFDTDSVIISFSSSEELTEELFSGIRHENINITPKYQTSSFARLAVKYENIDLEEIKKLSGMQEIKGISIYLQK
ncbi:MAG: hypothetical protein E7587_00455 [Ruminococcaceae bacterium]|nr:hypothetical protein [Oscillospiraceae bacterium]